MLRQWEVGNSLVEDDKLDLALDIIESAKSKEVNLCLPVDSINADAFDNDANKTLSKVDCVQDGFMGLDIGEETAIQFAEIIKNSATILWNGPMGVFEMENFSSGTKAVADAIVDATASGAFSFDWRG